MPGKLSAGSGVLEMRPFHWFIAALIFTSLGFGLAELIRHWRRRDPPPKPFSETPRREDQLRITSVPERLPLGE